MYKKMVLNPCTYCETLSQYDNRSQLMLSLMQVNINTNSLQINIYTNLRHWSELSWLQLNSWVGVSAGQKCCSAPLSPFWDGHNNILSTLKAFLSLLCPFRTQTSIQKIFYTFPFCSIFFGNNSFERPAGIYNILMVDTVGNKTLTMFCTFRKTYPLLMKEIS